MPKERFISYPAATRDGDGSRLLPRLSCTFMYALYMTQVSVREALANLLSRLELRIVDTVTAEGATSRAAAHRLGAANAVHLATAVVAGANRFVTSNLRDIPDTLTDIDITYPDSCVMRLSASRSASWLGSQPTR